MKKSKIEVWSVVSLWMLMAVSCASLIQADEGASHTSHTPQEHRAMTTEGGSESSSAEHHHHDPTIVEGSGRSLEVRSHQHDSATMEGSEGDTADDPHPHAAGLKMPGEHLEGHHHGHRPAILSPDEDRAYSELNHHTAGVFVLFAGGLALVAASGSPRYTWARYGWPGLFFLLGTFLFVRHDPESWPWGSLSLWEAIADPQVLQHVLFTFIVVGIGVIEFLRCRGTLSHSAWAWIFPILGISAAAMLFLHKHGSGPEADKIYRHHVIMACAGIAAMTAKGLDDSRLIRSRVNAYLWPGLMMFIGFMLLIYSE